MVARRQRGSAAKQGSKKDAIGLLTGSDHGDDDSVSRMCTTGNLLRPLHIVVKSKLHATARIQANFQVANRPLVEQKFLLQKPISCIVSDSQYGMQMLLRGCANTRINRRKISLLAIRTIDHFGL